MNVKNHVTAWLVEGEKRHLAGIHSNCLLFSLFFYHYFRFGRLFGEN